MCLQKQTIKHSYKLETINGEKLIPVWKVITKNDKSVFAEFILYPSAKPHNWVDGWNKANRQYAHTEWTSDTYDYGFHFFLTKSDADRYINTMIMKNVFNFDRKMPWRDELKVVKMHVRQRDILAKGIHTILRATNGSFRSLSTTEAYYKKG